MEHRFKSHKLLSIVVILIFVLLLINSVLLAKSTGFIHASGNATQIEAARKGATLLIDYYEKMAKKDGILENQAIREAMAQFKYDIEKAKTPEELARLQISYTQKIQDILVREQDTKKREEVLKILKNDPNLSKFEGDAVITVVKEDDKISVSDPTNLIVEDTINALNSSQILDNDTWSIIEISIRDGKLTLQTTRNLLDQLKLLETEIEELKNKSKQLQIAAGYEEMTGPGVIVELYDAATTNGFSSVNIVHDRDVRDVVNELFAAGATGIAVGDNRLIATSSIRCAGPIILVNQEPIAVDPITIYAIGEPKVLESSLKLIKSELQEFGIKVDITTKDRIVIPAYKEKK